MFARSVVIAALVAAPTSIASPSWCGFVPPAGNVVSRAGSVSSNSHRQAAWLGRPRPSSSFNTRLYAEVDEDPKIAEFVADEDGDQRLGDSKLIYDPSKGRFFEKEIEEICREEYCARDEKTGEPIILSVKEKERIFLDCIQSYYYNGRQLLTDEDFNKLKEDLIWEGSKVAYLNRNETLFLSAMSAYLKGTPILSDSEFDELKRSLKEADSPIAVSTEPKCYVDSGICTVTWQKDTWRMSLLYAPASLFTMVAWLIASFELFEPLRSVNPIVTLGLGSPLIYYSSKFLTENVFFNNPLIAYGPCPSCSAPNRLFFGDILGVEGPKDSGENTCKNCGAESLVQRNNLRCVTFPKNPDDVEEGKGKKKKVPVSAGADDE